MNSESNKANSTPYEIIIRVFILEAYLILIVLVNEFIITPKCHPLQNKRL